MLLDQPAAALAILLLAGFLPALLIAWRWRRFDPEGRLDVAPVQAVVWGGLGAAVIALVVESQLLLRVGDAALLGLPLVTVLLAPALEELVKGVGLLLLPAPEPRFPDGLMLGALAGLAFGAAESALLVIEAAAFHGGGEAVALATYRGLVTLPLHAATTALVGGGIWHGKATGRWSRAALALALAIAAHATYNLLAR